MKLVDAGCKLTHHWCPSLLGWYLTKKHSGGLITNICKIMWIDSY